MPAHDLTLHYSPTCCYLFFNTHFCQIAHRLQHIHTDVVFMFDVIVPHLFLFQIGTESFPSVFMRKIVSGCPAKSCCCIPRTQPALPALGSIFSPLQSVHAVSPSQLIHQMYGGINLLCRDNTSAAISVRYNLDARWSRLDKKGQEDHGDLVVSPWDRSPYSQGWPLSSTLEPFPQLVL